ncbi:Nitroreductase [Desulfurella amilsii]|uniref:Nitroreductase n=1 Tax=Desulfurella amilsii TaxID=1562698 RepID=A0A1X4XXM8_9BACT|nr:nitroreductase [Desulfurella amilsii]OSS42283.1 Nitroreductase [Desulfurella amilsii]
MTVLEAIKSRKSTRAFLDKPVEKEVLYKLFDIARFAPSGHNVQPWEILVLTGQTKNKLSDALVEAVKSSVERQYDYIYEVKDMPQYIKDRRRACNTRVFEFKNLDPKDKVALQEHILENFRFFNAPVELLLLREKNLGENTFIDIGIMAQTIMLLALEFGLASCPKTSIAAYAPVIKKTLNIPDTKMVIMSISLGYPDNNAYINKLTMDRIAVGDFVTFLD